MRRIWIALSLLLAVPAVNAADLWLHLNVSKPGGETTVLTLPLRAVEKVLPASLDDDDDTEIVVGDDPVSPAEFRAMLTELDSAPEGTAVSVINGDTRLHVVRTGQLLQMTPVAGSREMASLTMPLWLARALVGGSEWKYDLAGAVAALRSHGGGELMLIESSGEQTHIWVNQTPDNGEKP